MKIALYNCGEDSIFNTALMQISSFHKSKGDSVEWYHPLLHDIYNRIYASSLFDFTDKSYVTDKMICGGSGFDLTTKLPIDIENSDYDYSIYPACDYSIVWFSRGCIRKCPFCIVSKKEGYIYPVDPKNLNPNGKYIEVMDNNFFANPNWKEAVKILKSFNQPVDFQGIDARLLNEETAKVLNSFKHKKYIHIAWDNPKEKIDLEKITKWIKPYKLACYVLIGYWSNREEDLFRVEKLREMKISPFIMPFNKNDRYQMSLARYVNKKEIFNACTFEEYEKKINN